MENVENGTCAIISAEKVEMKKKDIKDWAWYPAKRLSEGNGIVGSVLKRIEEWEPFERIGNPEVRKMAPLARLRQAIRGGSEIEIKGATEGEEVENKGRVIEIGFEELSKPVQNYAIKEAEKTGVSVDEVIQSKAFKNYLRSRIK